jgi:exonuclease III
MPYFLRPQINLEKLLENYDIVCLQEDFLPSINIKKFNYNVCHIGNSDFSKIVDSGISIYSRVPLEFVNFISFNNLETVDKLSDKGFLIMKYFDLYIINIHLQSSYNQVNNNKPTLNQVKQIINYINSNKIRQFIILGDFNINLDMIKTDYNIIIPDNPTHYQHPTSMLKSSAHYKPGYIPLTIDGAIFNNLIISQVRLVNLDPYADHLGVELVIDYEIF